MESLEITNPAQVAADSHFETSSSNSWAVNGNEPQAQHPLGNTVYNIKTDPAPSLPSTAGDGTDTTRSVKPPTTKPKPAAEAKICYCDGHNQTDNPQLQPPVVCVACNNRIHQSCVVLMKSWARENMPLLGDDFYHFRCRRCTRGKERMKRLALTWVEVTHLALFNLSHSTAPRKTNDEEGLLFYSWHDICRFIDQNWKRFWLKPRTVTWENTVASCLSTHKQFIAGIKQPSHDQGLWALSNLMLPSMGEHGKRALPSSEIMIVADGSLQPFARAKPKKKRLAEELENQSGSAVGANDNTAKAPAKKQKTLGRSQSNTPLDEGSKASNSKPRKKLKKKQDEQPEEPEEYIDPATAIELYRDVDNPRAPVMMTQDTTHRARQVNVTDGGLTVTTDAGYCMAKATHGVWEGKWYYEAIINDHPGHTRIGWSQISGDLQAPCGYDQFSFGFRDSPGTLFHQSHRKKDAPDLYAAGYGPGDVLGMSIDLPESPDIITDLLPRLWDRTSLYMPFRARGPLAIAHGSEIRFWKNGEFLGVAFRDLPRGKYHPAISLYRGASVTLNFGPEFRFPLPAGGYRPLSESNELPRWAEIADAGVGGGGGVGVPGDEEMVDAVGAMPATTAAASTAEADDIAAGNDDEGNATPAPTFSSADGDGNEDEAEDDDEADAEGEDEDEDDADADADAEGATVISPSIGKMDPDDVSGVAALLSLATGGLNPSLIPAPPIPPPPAPLSSTNTLLLALEIDKKEAEVVDLIRRSSLPENDMDHGGGGGGGFTRVGGSANQNQPSTGLPSCGERSGAYGEPVIRS
ncbi:Set1/Ash2 histone methyltransferase complex subunit ASH2 [Geranomyces variabilis]|uniref:Set1/Ash2 histone methyltransferase complex subunit ASH2 n=1 Tax=Geranomyces variabilis TaxID=109894 RepID=A0AAD5TP72_9FUNG|nr:Set1/Ash2 histone methyltransferase complex subunit ASH2 [Geranomyces variabilis]